MRKVHVFVLATVLVAAAAVPSSAGGKSAATRTATATYAAGLGLDCERTLGCVSFVPQPGDRYLSVTVQDVSQTPVYATVTSTRRATPEAFGDGHVVCGTMTGSMRVTPGQAVYVYFENHLGSWHNCPGAASRGVVTATFYR